LRSKSGEGALLYRKTTRAFGAISPKGRGEANPAGKLIEPNLIVL
jgi:hypothetical protein